MSHRVSQLSPRTSTRGTKVIAFPVPSTTSWSSTDAQFLRTWFEEGSEFDPEFDRGSFNWRGLSGLALALAVSATFWIGLAWIVSRAWT